MKNKVLYNILLVIFAAIFLVCAGFLIKYFIDSYESQNKYNDLASLHGNRPPVTSTPTGSSSAATQPTTSQPVFTIPTPGPSIPEPSVPEPSIPGTEPSVTVPTPPPTTIPAPTMPPILEEMQALYDLNKHTVGWVKISGTNIDYPVVQTPNTAQWRDYYLYRDFYGDDDDRGCIYVREACDVFTPSDNVVVYGHHMKDGTMFGDLNKYWLYGKYFYRKHKTIEFDTLYERHTYKIFAVFVTSGTYGEGYPYHMFVNAEDEADFDRFVQDCKELSLYKSEFKDITPQYGDKLLCLSTCNYSIKNGRLVVCAYRID